MRFITISGRVAARVLAVGLVLGGAAACAEAQNVAPPIPASSPTSAPATPTALPTQTPLAALATTTPILATDVSPTALPTQDALPTATPFFEEGLTDPLPGDIPAPTQVDPARLSGLADWVKVAPGVRVRALTIPARWQSEETQAVLVLVDPARVDVTMHYDRGAPASVAEWSARLGAPAVVINAGYFQQNFAPAGLVVAAGDRLGQSFGATRGHAEGMLSLVGGQLHIRALEGQPYDPAEPLDQAVQGLPMLVGPSVPSFDLPELVAPRTAVALDQEGRLLLIHVPGPVTLTRLRDWLIGEGELGIVTALNLDGGYSAGMVVGGLHPVHDDSVRRVPGVLVVSAR